jgi:hypothetical protein
MGHTYERVQEDATGQYYLERGRVIVEMMDDADGKKLSKMMAFVLKPTDQVIGGGDAAGMGEADEVSTALESAAPREKEIHELEKRIGKQQDMLETRLESQQETLDKVVKSQEQMMQMMQKFMAEKE